jgi:hypothetical protein
MSPPHSLVAFNDRRDIEVTSDVLLVSIEALTATLATMAHLSVFDGDAAIDGAAPANRGRALRAALEILFAHDGDRRASRPTGARGFIAPLGSFALPRGNDPDPAALSL